MKHKFWNNEWVRGAVLLLIMYLVIFYALNTTIEHASLPFKLLMSFVIVGVITIIGLGTL